ncbi:unnamed protein product [Clonostachys chloroleuca]|uniref:Uncharacterized protein n=1 Tax=Clonostachys chloroleuca TaxID=1926264 RepID=A0AA35M141_9HYPO|nr:unnamed protein product [Clonostachys chloroleuca]
MFIRILLLTGALIAAFVAFYLSSSPEERPPYIQGRNRTALFISNIEHGLSNVHIATASSILENYPDIEVHYASFSSLDDKLARVSKFTQAKTPAAKEITYHEIDGKAYWQCSPSLPVETAPLAASRQNAHPARVVRNLAMVPPGESAFTAEFLIRSMDIISL